MFLRHTFVNDQLRFICARRHTRIHALLWRDAKPNIIRKVGIDRSVRFDMHALAVAPQCLNERRRLGLRERLAAGENHHRAISAGFTHLLDHFIHAREKLRRIIRVAKVTRKIAARQAHEDRRRPGPHPFALNAVEDLS